MNKVYFENVPNFGSLYLEKILFSFENIPIVFVCLDKKEKRYLCLCDDVIEEESWIIVQITNEKLLKILKDEDTILSAYKDRKIIVANKSIGKEIKYFEEDYNKIDSDELPVSDQYLEMKEYLSDYIEKINTSSFAELFLSSDFIFQSDINDFLQYILNISVSYGHLHKNDSIIHENLTTNTLNYHNGSSFKIELEHDENNIIEQKEWHEYNTMIYAA